MGLCTEIKVWKLSLHPKLCHSLELFGNEALDFGHQFFFKATKFFRGSNFPLYKPGKYSFLKPWHTVPGFQFKDNAVFQSENECPCTDTEILILHPSLCQAIVKYKKQKSDTVKMLQPRSYRKGTIKFTFSIKYKKPPFSVIPQQQRNGGRRKSALSDTFHHCFYPSLSSIRSMIILYLFSLLPHPN